MPAFFGNTSGIVSSTAYNLPTKITAFSLVNKSGGGITVNVGIISGSAIFIIPLNKALAAGEAYIYSGDAINVLAGYSIYVSVSGSTDYYFTIENV